MAGGFSLGGHEADAAPAYELAGLDASLTAYLSDREEIDPELAALSTEIKGRVPSKIELGTAYDIRHEEVEAYRGKLSALGVSLDR